MTVSLKGWLRRWARLEVDRVQQRSKACLADGHHLKYSMSTWISISVCRTARARWPGSRLEGHCDLALTLEEFGTVTPESSHNQELAAAIGRWWMGVLRRRCIPPPPFRAPATPRASVPWLQTNTGGGKCTWTGYLAVGPRLGYAALSRPADCHARNFRPSNISSVFITRFAGIPSGRTTHVTCKQGQHLFGLGSERNSVPCPFFQVRPGTRRILPMYGDFV